MFFFLDAANLQSLYFSPKNKIKKRSNCWKVFQIIFYAPHYLLYIFFDDRKYFPIR